MEHAATFPKTLQEAIKYFSDKETCTTFMAQMRWPDGVTCPHCQGKKVSYLSTRFMWKCMSKTCHKQFSVKVGTIMEDSAIALEKWLAAIWLIANAKNGISSYEVHRAVGVTQKSAWFLLHRIRLAMQTGTFEKLSGQVEVDETYIGGKARNMHRDKRERRIQGTGGKGKVAVMGLLERDGKVRAKVIADATKVTLHGEVRGNVEAGAELFTDALNTYMGLEADYIHQVINHAEKYVDGQIHTNGIENFWSLLKRGIKGTYVSVEPFHLFRYLDEQTFRFNERKGKDADRFVQTVKQIAGKRLTFDELIGKDTCH
ncbi:MAG: IS1595 family transposase [Acidobacteria bacterium]|nr:IS1595 family transposase [Acidobacteriota bacterium]